MLNLKNFEKKKINYGKDFDLDFSKIKKTFQNEKIDFFLPWFLKYKLDDYNEICENLNVKKITNYLNSINSKKKAVFLHGQAGCGKTTSVYLIAKKFDFEIFEINASDNRNKKSIFETLNVIDKQKSITNKKKLILIEEIDGVSGVKDRGGISEIINFIKTTKNKYIITANEIELDKLKSIKKICEVVNFESEIFSVLFNLGKKILKNEKVKFNENDLKNFIEVRNLKDIRGFINDLQSSVVNNKFLCNEEFELRDYKLKINNVLHSIFFEPPINAIKNQFNSDIDFLELKNYLEENIPKIFDYIGIGKSFLEMSKSDIFEKRIYKRNYWRFLVYIFFYLTFGVSNSKNKVQKVLTYERNKRQLSKFILENKFGRFSSRTKLQKQKDEPLSFIEKISNLYKHSILKTKKNDFPYFLFCYKNNKDFRKTFSFENEKELNKLLSFV